MPYSIHGIKLWLWGGQDLKHTLSDLSYVDIELKVAHKLFDYTHAWWGPYLYTHTYEYGNIIYPSRFGAEIAALVT